MELLSAELESQKQEAAQLQDRERQHRRFALDSHFTVLSRVNNNNASIRDVLNVLSVPAF